MQDAFTIQIAELTARVQPLFVTTREYCRAYLSDSEPELYIEISENDLVYEQEMAEKEAVEEGLRIRTLASYYHSAVPEEHSRCLVVNYAGLSQEELCRLERILC